MNTQESGYGRKVGVGPMRYFTVTFTADSPARAEAVQFFSKYTRLRESPTLPGELDVMNSTEAQNYLDSNPVQKRSSSLSTATSQPSTACRASNCCSEYACG